MTCVPIVSGGLDSVTMAHHLFSQGVHLDSLISFDYGQRHAKELDCARECAQMLGVPHAIVGLGAVLGSLTSALTAGDVAVPDGHYAEDSMRATIVPGRNLLMIAAAAAYAVDRNVDGIAIGVHGGDHFIYPDCRSEFINAAADAVHAGYNVALWAPFLKFDKTDIAKRAQVLGVPIERTWSCYKGGEVHCGTCGTCVERREAMFLASVTDRTEYAQTPPLPVAP